MTAIILIGAIFSEVAGTLCMRMASGPKKLWWLGVAVGYLSAFVLLSVTLAHGMPIGVAYGIWAASGVALTAVLSKVLFQEPLTWLMGAGIAMIAAGVLLVELGASH